MAGYHEVSLIIKHDSIFYIHVESLLKERFLALLVMGDGHFWILIVI